MLRHVVYKRNEKDFATRVVEDDATGKVTQYVGDAAVVTAITDPVTGGIELSVGSETVALYRPPLISLASTSRLAAAEIATSSGYKVVPAGTVKIETMTVACPEQLESVSTLYYPIDVAETSGLLLCRDVATNKSLYSYNGQAFNLVHTFLADYNILIAKEIDTPSGVVWVVVTKITSATQAGVNVYRSTDRGLNWTVVLHETTAYGVAPSETVWVNGQSLIFGEYFENTPGRYPRLWYSTDAGATWAVYQTTTCNGSHYHWCADIDGTPMSGWIIAFGDGTYSRIIKLTCDGVSFSETALPCNIETHCLTKLNSGRWLKTEHGISAYDPIDYGASNLLRLHDESASGKFPYGNESSGFRLVFEYRGIVYGCYTAYTASKPYNGLYASADDGDTWVCIYRNGSANFGGIRIGFGLGDYVYLQPLSGYGTSTCFRIPAITAAVVGTARSDLAICNRIVTSALSSFTNADGTPAPTTTAGGGWGTDVAYENPANGAPALIEVIPGGFDGSGHCLHFVTKAANVAGQINVISTPPLSVLCAGNVPVAGDYFLATAKLKAKNYKNYNLQFLMRGVPVADYSSWLFNTVGSEWMTLVVYGKWLAAPTATCRMWLRIDNPSTDASTNVEIDCYLDAVRLYVSKNPLWVVGNRNGVINQQASADVISIPVEKIESGSVIFQMTNSAAIEQTDGVIVSLNCAAGKKLTLSYAAGAYVLSDGTTSAQSSARIRSLTDVVQICINYGTEATLIIKDTNADIETVGVGSGIKCSLPSLLNMGGDVQNGKFTAGNFYGVVHSGKTFSADDIVSVWKRTLEI